MSLLKMKSLSRAPLRVEAMQNTQRSRSLMARFTRNTLVATGDDSGVRGEQKTWKIDVLIG